MNEPKTVEPWIFLSAGEASGEHYGAMLIAELKRRIPDSRFFGLGGARMEALGMQRVVRSEDVAVMGITEVIRHLPHIYREYRKLQAAIRARRPAAAVLIDFPDVNLKLAETLHGMGVPVIFFVSPQLWAWKKHRIHSVRRFVDRMLVIFPFEEKFYREHGVAAEFVGHPLAEMPLPTETRAHFAAQHGLDAEKSWIGLLPGSRAREIRLNLPEMLRAAARIADERTEFVLPLAPTLSAADVERTRTMVKDAGMDKRVRLVDDARGTLHFARASVVASGTATVEAALIGNPFVVVYKVSRLTYAIARQIVKVPHVAMVNLIADQRLVPELIQDDYTVDSVVKHLQPLMENTAARDQMMRELKEVGAKLRPDRNLENGAIQRVAEVVAETLA